MTATLLVLAGLMGAAGVALAAIGTHAYPGTGIESAGHILLFHAAAALGAVAALHGGLLSRSLGSIAAAGLVAGALLFAIGVTLPIFAGVRSIGPVAPTGGVVLILGWVALALAAVI